MFIVVVSEGTAGQIVTEYFGPFYSLDDALLYNESQGWIGHCTKLINPKCNWKKNYCKNKTSKSSVSKVKNRHNRGQSNA